MGLKRVIFFLAFCMGLSLAAGQSSSSPPASTSTFRPGVVVESVAPYSEGARAGLAEGDIVLRWERDDASGATQSPFDLAAIEIEQAPRGLVTLEGLHGEQQKTWSLGQDTWGIEARPNFPDSLLAAYREGQELAAAGNLNDASNKWRTIAGQLQSRDPAWLRSWLFFHIAQVQAKARAWKETDEAYAAAAESAEAESGTVALLQRAWASSFTQRSEWAHANEHYRLASAALGQQAAKESLALSLDLDNLGAVAYKRGDLSGAEEFTQQSLHIRQTLAPGSLVVSRSLATLGNIGLQRGDLAGAEKLVREALAIQDRVAPEGLDVAKTITILGIVVWDRGDLDQGEECDRRALAIRQQRAPDSMDVANTLNNLGVDAAVRGDLAKAEAYYLQALAIKERLSPGGLEVSGSLLSLGDETLERGDLAKSEEYIHQALTIREKLAPGSLLVADTFNELGLVTWKLGDLRNAEGYYLKALAIRQKLAPGSLVVATVLNNLGLVAWQRGDLHRAEDYHLQALAIREKLAPGSLQFAMSMDNLMLVALENGDLSKAEEYSQQGYAIYQRLAPDSLMIARSLENLGLVARQRRQLAGAEDYFQRAVDIREKLAPMSVELGRNLNRLGGTVRDRGDLARAEGYYRHALTVWDKLAPGSNNQAEALAALASLSAQRGQLAEAASLYQQALDTLDEQARNLGGTEDVRAGFRAKYESYYQEYASLLIHQGKIDLAFATIERARARTLLETLTTAHLEIHQRADPALLDKERLLRENINAKSDVRIRLLSGKHAEEQVAGVDKEISGLRDQFQTVEEQLRAASPAYAALTQPQPLTGDQVRHSLDVNTVLLEYSLGEQRSYVFAVTADSIVAHELPPQAEIEHLARNVYEALTARKRSVKGETTLQREVRWAKADKDFRSQSSQLSRILLEPVVTEIEGKRLLVVSDGALQYIPFAALPDPAQASGAWTPLAIGHEVVNLPSASVLAVLRQQEQQRRPAARTVAVLADPVFSTLDARVGTKSRGRYAEVLREASAPASGAPSQSVPNTIAAESLTRSVRDVGLQELSRLPFSHREAEVIISLAPRGQSMEALGFRATRATATDPELRQYRIIHFATHGLLDSQHPELSGLVLSLVDEQGKPQNGFLSLEDIYNLNLPADLVVLSACETGLGKAIDGEGLIGLTRGFMYAGANRVVASLWSVDDAATAELMSAFYRSMLHDGLTPAAALRRAQMQMRRNPRWKAPYYWAAFQIQGDWK